GIDIRAGLQLECIACTQCIDACDAIMDRIGKPRGLVRYASQQGLERRGPPRLLRMRTILYPVVLAVVVGALGLVAGARSPIDVTILRGIGAPFTALPDGRIENQLRLKVQNRGATSSL